MKIKGKLTCVSTVAIFLAALFALAVTTASAQPAGNAVATQGQVTFTKDVAPILQEHCQTCHRAGQMAPMSLLTYQEARPWARDMKQRVLTRTMPPWFLDKTVGIQHFANDISLSDQQIATIVKWVDEGAPQGDPKDMPAPKVFDDTGWQLPKILGRPPDLILEGADDTIKVGDQDQWFRPVTDVGLTEPRWVMAIEMRPSTVEARKVFHHIDASLLQDDTNAPSAQVKVSLGSNDSDTAMAQDGGFMEWAVGKNYDIFREGTGKLIMPGAKIAWEYHTHAGADHEITAHAQMALYLYPKGVTPRYRVYHERFQAYNRATLDIPPNTIHATQGYTVLKAPGRIENFQPHMHLTGKAMSMEAILPDGTSELLTYVDHFNFNWMINYIYAEDDAPVLPKGTVIHVTAWLDNTMANPNDADPNQWVGYGERSVDAMAFAHVNVTYLSDQDYQEWLAKHPGKVHGPAGKPEGVLSADSKNQ